MSETLLPCPFCGTELVEAHSFATRTSRTFVHSINDDEPCVGASIRVKTNDPGSIRAWNRRPASEAATALAERERRIGELEAVLLQLTEALERVPGLGFETSTALSAPYANAKAIIAGASVGDLKAAKAAAQADYERRIRSALVPTPAPVVEALRSIVEFCDDPNGSEQSESLAMGMARLLPAARAALEQKQ